MSLVDSDACDSTVMAAQWPVCDHACASDSQLVPECRVMQSIAASTPYLSMLADKPDLCAFPCLKNRVSSQIFHFIKKNQFRV